MYYSLYIEQAISALEAVVKAVQERKVKSSVDIAIFFLGNTKSRQIRTHILRKITAYSTCISPESVK